MGRSKGEDAPEQESKRAREKGVSEWVETKELSERRGRMRMKAKAGRRGRTFNGHVSPRAMSLP